jgi:hypothetical protein
MDEMDEWMMEWKELKERLRRDGLPTAGSEKDRPCHRQKPRDKVLGSSKKSLV